MDVSSIRPGAGVPVQQRAEISAADAAERRALTQATRTINESGAFGKDELVFLIDPKTHRPIIRVQDRATNEVVMQIPPEVVLRLAENWKFR
jgi:uncharacterized FlaG/YvyC family protein